MGRNMSKRTRQYVGLFLAILTYYVIHEGAHLIYALKIDVFKKINFIGLGVQIDVFAEKMTENQLGIFCIAGSVATMILQRRYGMKILFINLPYHGHVVPTIEGIYHFKSTIVHFQT